MCLCGRVPDADPSHYARFELPALLCQRCQCGGLLPHLMPLSCRRLEEFASKASLMLRFEWRAVLSISARLSQSAWC